MCDESRYSQQILEKEKEEEEEVEEEKAAEFSSGQRQSSRSDKRNRTKRGEREREREREREKEESAIKRRLKRHAVPLVVFNLFLLKNKGEKRREIMEWTQ